MFLKSSTVSHVALFLLTDYIRLLQHVDWIVENFWHKFSAGIDGLDHY
jgi:hypothetical protein